jgi:predicted nucleotidyltransferase
MFMETQLYIDKFVHLFKDELRDNLSGIYLHGSLAMNCFNPKGSDIDFIVVVRDNLTRENERRIIQNVLDLHNEMINERGIEFSVILESNLKPFRYPTPFELHYSDLHRERYLMDGSYKCGGAEDKDLASQLMVAYNRGKCLYGKSLDTICEPIKSKYYIDSIYHDVESAIQEVNDCPVYVVLNLCRVLYYLKEGQVSSKKEGGEWAIKSLSQDYQLLITKCLDNYASESDELKLDNRQLLLFATYMLEEIKQLIV